MHELDFLYLKNWICNNQNLCIKPIPYTKYNLNTTCHSNRYCTGCIYMLEKMLLEHKKWFHLLVIFIYLFILNEIKQNTTRERQYMFKYLCRCVRCVAYERMWIILSINRFIVRCLTNCWKIPMPTRINARAHTQTKKFRLIKSTAGIKSVQEKTSLK